MLNSYDPEERRRSKMRSEDRVLVLSPIEGKSTLDSNRKVDNRLFNGENKLHAYFEDMTGMWKLKYDSGSLPGGLDQKFMTFSNLLETTQEYFKKRNIEVTEVQD